MNVRYRVELSQAERDELTAMLSGGKHAARRWAGKATTCSSEARAPMLSGGKHAARRLKRA